MASNALSMTSLQSLSGPGKGTKSKEEEIVKGSTKDLKGSRDLKSEVGRSTRDLDRISHTSEAARSNKDLDKKSEGARSHRDLDKISYTSEAARSNKDLDKKSEGARSHRDLDKISYTSEAARSNKEIDRKSEIGRSTRDLDKISHVSDTARSTKDLDKVSEVGKSQYFDRTSEIGKSTRDLDKVNDTVSFRHMDVSKPDHKKGTIPKTDISASRWTLSNQPVDVTKCPICTRHLASPKILPCLHTFCEACICRHAANSLSEDKGAQIKCPVCTTPVTSSRSVADPAEFATSLPVNHFISSLMIQNFVQQKVCKPCQKAGKNTKAITWCSYCAETLCHEHDNYHRSLTSSDVHPVSTIEEVQQDNLISYVPGICKKHDEKLKYYCEFHREPACELCHKTIHRMCDDIITADRAAEAFKNSPETSALLKILDSADAQTEEVVQGRKANIKELEEGKKREAQTISQFREEVNHHLDSLEQILREDLDKKHAMKTKEIKREIDTFQMNRNTIAYYKGLLESILRRGSGIQILTELSKVAQQCHILEEKIQHRASKIKRISYDLKQNDIVSGMDSLGSVDFVHTAIVATPAPEEWHKIRGKKSVAKANHVRENTHDFLVIRYPSSKITGGTTLRSKLLLVDHSGREIRGYNDVGHRDESLTFVFKRNPWDVTTLPQRDGIDIVAVTMPNECMIELIEFGAVPNVDKVHYTTRNSCYGITYVDGQVIVACTNGLEIFDLLEDHRLVSRAFLRVAGEKVHNVFSADKSRVYYSESTERGSLFCITLDGTEIFEYSHSNLRRPAGISTDAKGNVYVAGYHSNNIHQLSPEGALLHIITPRSKTFYKPIVLIEHEERMYSVFGKHKVIVFT